jgi:hypothetical protein
MNDTDKKNFAMQIMAMNYGTLKGICGDFAEMCADGNGCRERPKSDIDYAELLFDWAEATLCKPS